MLDFFMNVQQSSGGGGALPDDYTYNQHVPKAPAPTHMLLAPSFQGVASEYRIYDITSLPTITQTSAWAAGGYNDYLDSHWYAGHHGAIKDGYFYVVTYNRELHVYDFTNPSSVTNLSKIYDSGPNNIYDVHCGVYAHPTKDILWVLSSYTTPYLTTLDISNPASPSIISTITPYGDPDVSALSRDGERLMYKTGAELVSYGLDASGNASGLQSDPIPGGTFPVTTALRASNRMEMVEAGSGNNYIIASYGQANTSWVVKLGADYIPDFAAVVDPSTLDNDAARMVYPFPWAESSFSDDVVYWKVELDDNELQVSSFDPNTDAFTHHGSVVDTTNLGLSGTGRPVDVDGWDNYIVTARINLYVTFWEYDPVADTVTKIAELSRTTSPDIHDWGAGGVYLFSVP